MAASTLELRLSVPDFVSQFWRKIRGKAWKVARECQRTNKKIHKYTVQQIKL